MDKKLKIAYILTGIALIGLLDYNVLFVDKFVVPISIILLFFSIMGSIRARVALIGCLLSLDYLFVHIILYGLAITDVNEKLFHKMSFTVFCVITLMILVGIVLLLISIKIKEASSRISGCTSIELTAVLFLVFIIWNFTQLYIYPMIDYNTIIRMIYRGTFDMQYLVFTSFLIIILCAFIVISFLRKKVIGFILAPVVLTMVTIIKINTILVHLYRSKIYKVLNIYDVLSYYVFPLLATTVTVFFFLCLKEDTLGIVTAKLKNMRGVKNEKG